MLSPTRWLPHVLLSRHHTNAVHDSSTIKHVPLKAWEEEGDAETCDTEVTERTPGELHSLLLAVIELMLIMGCFTLVIVGVIIFYYLGTIPGAHAAPIPTVTSSNVTDEVVLKKNAASIPVYAWPRNFYSAEPFDRAQFMEMIELGLNPFTRERLPNWKSFPGNGRNGPATEGEDTRQIPPYASEAFLFRPQRKVTDPNFATLKMEQEPTFLLSLIHI